MRVSFYIVFLIILIFTSCKQNKEEEKVEIRTLEKMLEESTINNRKFNNIYPENIVHPENLKVYYAVDSISGYKKSLFQKPRRNNQIIYANYLKNVAMPKLLKYFNVPISKADTTIEVFEKINYYQKRFNAEHEYRDSIYLAYWCNNLESEIISGYSSKFSILKCFVFDEFTTFSSQREYYLNDTVKVSSFLYSNDYDYDLRKIELKNTSLQNQSTQKQQEYSYSIVGPVIIYSFVPKDTGMYQLSSDIYFKKDSNLNKLGSINKFIKVK